MTTAPQTPTQLLVREATLQATFCVLHLGATLHHLRRLLHVCLTRTIPPGAL